MHKFFLFSKRSANITKMHWNKIKHFLWKNAISYCVFPTEIHNSWNAFFAKQHSENNCAVLKEKIERFTYEQKFTIFRICFNDIKGFLYFNQQIKKLNKKTSKKIENIHTTFVFKNQNKKFQNICKRNDGVYNAFSKNKLKKIEKKFKKNQKQVQIT